MVSTIGMYVWVRVIERTKPKLNLLSGKRSLCNISTTYLCTCSSHLFRQQRWTLTNSLSTGTNTITIVLRAQPTRNGPLKHGGSLERAKEALARDTEHPKSEYQSGDMGLRTGREGMWHHLQGLPPCMPI